MSPQVSDEPDLAQRLDAYLDDRSAELLMLAGEMVAVDSQIPPVANEVAIVDYLQRVLSDFGLPSGEVFAKDPDRPNLVITLAGSGDGPRLLLNGHVDTKPVGGAAHLWHTNPLEPEVVDGHMYGLGTSDMKAACAAMIFAMRAINDLGVALDGDLILALTADEEAGARYGARYLAPLLKGQADACLIGEPSGWERDFQALHVVSRGLLCFRVKVSGTQMHSSLSDRMPSVNATVKMAALINDLAQFDRLTYQAHRLGDVGPTLNVGVRVEGGTYYGVVPGSASFACDLRALPGMTEGSVLTDLHNWLNERLAADPDLDATIVVEPELPWIPPSEISGSHPLVCAVQDSARQVLGATPDLGIFPGGTDAPWFDRAGVPTVPSFGPGVLTCCHGPNERVSVGAILQAAKIYARSALRYCRTV